MEERAVYSTETGRWYKFDDEPFAIKNIPQDRVIRPVMSVDAMDYYEAFRGLYGHEPFVAPVVREQRRVVFA